MRLLNVSRIAVVAILGMLWNTSAYAGSILPSWPDAIACNLPGQGPAYVFFPQNMPYSGDGLFYYYNVYSMNNKQQRLAFNSSQAFAASNINGGAGNCQGKTIAQLTASGQAISFAGPGPAGPAGTNGTNGINGTNGLSVVSAGINSSGQLVLTLSDGSTVITPSSVVGSTGPQGPQGVPGTWNYANAIGDQTEGAACSVNNTSSTLSPTVSGLLWVCDPTSSTWKSTNLSLK